jgi:signal transduction histidine kinase/CheY-like chemotaxis protein
LADTVAEWENRLHPDDRPRVLNLVDKCVAGQRHDFDVEFRLRHKDGSYRWILSRGVAERLEDGRVQRLTGCHIDVSALKQLSADYLHAQRLESIGRLAGGLAHDFNNILTAILGVVDLTKCLPEFASCRSHLEIIERAANRGAALTKQLLAFARKQVVQPRIINLAEHLQTSEKLLKQLIGEDIQLQTIVRDHQARICIDPSQFEQLLLNLAVNARDAMPGGGCLTIECSTRGHASDTLAGQLAGPAEAVIRVTDTGVGIHSDHLDRVFEPFFTTKEEGKGTGLGLATCFGIVTQRGGSISVDSTVGRGTTFEIRLPLAQDVAERISNVSAMPTVVTPSSETVLVVEDDDAVRNISARTLRAQGFAVLEAASGHEALELFARTGATVDLVLTDVVMPGISGIQLADRFSVISSPTPPRFLFMSGYAEDVITQRGLIKPGVELLQKPFRPGQLVEKVRESLGAPPAPMVPNPLR